MEKVIEQQVVKEQSIHEFYCDYCGVKVLETYEFDDGYYYKPESNMKRRKIRGDKFEATIERCVCDDCVNNFEKNQDEFYKRLCGLLKKYGYSIIE